MIGSVRNGTSLLQGVQLDENKEVKWSLDSKENFTTSSLYQYICFGGVIDRQVIELWNCKMPLKIRIFVWQVVHDRILSGDQFCKRGGQGSGCCKLCGQPESNDRIMFECPLARFVWINISKAFCLEWTPTCCGDFLVWVDRQSNPLRKCAWFGLGAPCWSLWNIRNKMMFENKFVKQPVHVLFVLISFFQQWKPLWNEKDHHLVEFLKEKIRRQILRLKKTRRFRDD